MFRVESGKTWYSLSTESILALRKYPELLDLVRLSHGEAAVTMLEEMIKTGSLSLSHLLHGLGSSLQIEDRVKLYQSLFDYKKSFLRLLGDGYIQSVDGQKQEVDIKV